MLTLHLNYVAGCTGPFLLLFERTHNYYVDNQGLVPWRLRRLGRSKVRSFCHGQDQIHIIECVKFFSNSFECAHLVLPNFLGKIHLSVPSRFCSNLLSLPSCFVWVHCQVYCQFLERANNFFPRFLECAVNFFWIFPSVPSSFFAKFQNVFSAPSSFFYHLLERWPQVCHVKITFELLRISAFVSTKRNSMKGFVNCIPLNTHVRLNTTQPCLNHWTKRVVSTGLIM